MAATVIIPARMGSRRLPGKVLEAVGGVPMVVAVLRRAQRARGVVQVVVATDDVRVADAVAAHGGTVVLTGSHHLSGTDRVAEAAARMGVDLVVNVQGDEPLIEPSVIEAVIDRLVSGDAPVVTVSAPLESDPAAPERVKVVTDVNGRALFFSRKPIPTAGPWRVHLGVYGFRAAALRAFASWPPGKLERSERLEQLRFLENGMAISVVQVHESAQAVDTPADLERVRAIIGGAQVDR